MSNTMSSIFFGGHKPPIFSSRLQSTARTSAAQQIADLVGPIESTSNFRCDGNPYKISATEIAALKAQINILPQHTTFKILGARNFGETEFHSGGVVFAFPDTIDPSAGLSVCGRKGPLVEQLVEFSLPEQPPIKAIGMGRAYLEISDSPTHKHGITNELYQPRKLVSSEYIPGNIHDITKPLGLMYLEQDGEFEIHKIMQGEGLELNPGVTHGWFGLYGPTELYLDFKPALVPKPTVPNISANEIALRQRLRDEQIVYDSTYERIKEAIS